LSVKKSADFLLRHHNLEKGSPPAEKKKRRERKKGRKGDGERGRL